jgi:hypothetical protein
VKKIFTNSKKLVLLIYRIMHTQPSPKVPFLRSTVGYISLALIAWTTVSLIVSIVIGNAQIFWQMVVAGFALFVIGTVSIVYLDTIERSEGSTLKTSNGMGFMISMIAAVIMLAGVISRFSEADPNGNIASENFFRAFFIALCIGVFFLVTQLVQRYIVLGRAAYSVIYGIVFMSSAVFLATVSILIAFAVPGDEVIAKLIGILLVLQISGLIALPILYRIQFATALKTPEVMGEKDTTMVLTKLYELYESGAITREEFDAKKHSLLHK